MVELSEEIRTAILANVDLLNAQLLGDAGVAAGDWENSLEYLSGYIERQRDDWSDETQDRIIQLIGSYLGEAVANIHQGAWFEDQNGIGVDVRGLKAFPFAKTSKHIRNGPDDNIVSFIRTIPALLKQQDKDTK